MANVNIPRPDNLGGVSDEVKNYLNSVIDQLEYILNNLDQDNMTDHYNKKGK